MKTFAAVLAVWLGTAGIGLHDPPKITSIWLSRSDAQGGDVVRGRVKATKNTASVEVRIGGYGMVMHKIDSFTFVGRYTVPEHLPFVLHRSWTVRVIARNVDGVASERDTSIAIH